MRDQMRETPEQIPPEAKIRPFVRLEYSSNEATNKDGSDGNITRQDIEIFDSTNTSIGSISLEIEIAPDKPDSSNAQILVIVIDTKFYGKGFGKSAYLELLKYLGNIPLVSGVINNNSTPIWESLVRDGLAIKECVGVDGKPKSVSYKSIPEAVKQYFSENKGQDS